MKIYAVISLVLVVLFSCKKDDKTKTKTELLTNGSWHVTAYVVDPAIDWDSDGDDETNVYEIMDECVKDDHTTFFANGTGELDEGASKCDPGDPQDIPLSWKFEQNDTQLSIAGVIYLVDTLTESRLIVKQIEVISAVTVTHTVTFSH
jgi:hypothetical protein